MQTDCAPAAPCLLQTADERAEALEVDDTIEATHETVRANPTPLPHDAPHCC